MDATTFERHKSSSLSGIDLSRKGSIDAPIHGLVNYINDQSAFFTTSSCSGRILVFENQDSAERVKKKGCVWLHITHDYANVDDVMQSLESLSGQAVFKFEPFVLHVQCLSIEDAQKLHAVAIASGFRNSGISIGGKGKIIMAVRSTHSMEVPLSEQGKLLVTREFIEYLVKCANAKMKENLLRIDRFSENMKQMVSKKDLPETGRRTKRNHRQSAPKHDRRDNVDTAAGNQVEDSSADGEEIYNPSLFEIT